MLLVCMLWGGGVFGWGVGWWWGGGAGGGGGATKTFLKNNPLACVRSVAENVAPRGPPVSHFGYFRPSWRR